MRFTAIEGTASAGEQDGALLKAMFEERKRVFVDLLKWNVPVVDDRYEIDQFDDAEATYLVLAEQGMHVASARLLRTDRPHILDTLYPELCVDPPPRGAHTREITRFCLARRLGGRARRDIRNRLVTALAEYALLTGIATYTGIAEIAWLQQILAFGWDCRPLGLPQRRGAHVLGALKIEITGETPHLLRAGGVYAAVEIAAAPVLEVA